MSGTRFKTKSTNPLRRLGIYKSVDDVPEHHRIARARGSYDGRDVWTEWRSKVGERAERTDKKIDRTGRMWREYAGENGFHPGLAEPSDVNGWVIELLETRKPGTIYSAYWVYLNRFYSWLANHPDHPAIRYDPTLMAAAHCEATRRVWKAKVSRSGNR